MLILLAIGFVAGIVTALSPCVLPVLPVVLAGGATGRRPFAIVAGIVASFTVFTLFAAWLLNFAGLPDDLLRNVAIALLFLVALSLLVPQVADWLARPLQVLTRRSAGDRGGGFLLGASLGLVFVPCAGPVLAAVTVIAARREVGLDAVLLTLAYAVGASIPMLAIALAGERAARAVRARAETVRRISAVLVGAAAVTMALGVDRELQTVIPGYTEALQERFERSGAARRELRELTGGRDPEASGGASSTAGLDDYGPAPEFRGITRWLNSKPLTLEGLRGRVVLIDFWTYSCISCLRTLPYVRDWHDRYERAGLTIVGVHSPKFSFERVEQNVRENAADLDVRWPIALDNESATWAAWHNQDWPAKYLIDREGRVRYFHFGEGGYAETEGAIRQLLAEAGRALPPRVPKQDESPNRLVTPETYLGYARIDRNGGEPVERGAANAYAFPRRLADNELAFGGTWTVERERAIAGPRAKLKLAYRARDVFLVLSGKGSVDVLVDGKREASVRVDADRLYPLARRVEEGEHLLELRLTPGLSAYAFTFG